MVEDGWLRQERKEGMRGIDEEGFCTSIRVFVSSCLFELRPQCPQGFLTILAAIFGSEEAHIQSLEGSKDPKQQGGGHSREGNISLKNCHVS